MVSKHKTQWVYNSSYYMIPYGPQKSKETPTSFVLGKCRKFIFNIGGHLSYVS